MKKIFAAAMLILLSAVVAHADNPVPVGGKWQIVFSGNSSISTAEVNIVQNPTTGQLSSPYFSGNVAGETFMNYEALSDSVCSPTGAAPVAPTGSKLKNDNSFVFVLPVDFGVSYTLTGDVANTGKTITGSFTSNCTGDRGTYVATKYGPANISTSGIISGSSSEGPTSYLATISLTEDANFQVTGTIKLQTVSGGATCYGTISVFGPATGSMVELGGSNANVQMIGLLIQANNVSFTSVEVDTLLLSSTACGDDPISGTLGHKHGKVGRRK